MVKVKVIIHPDKWDYALKPSADRSQYPYALNHWHFSNVKITGSWRLFYNCLLEDFLFFAKVDILKI